MDGDSKISRVTRFDARRFKGVRRCGGILDEIVNAKAAALSKGLDGPAFSRGQQLRKAVSEPSSGEMFEQALKRPGTVNIIAEIKKRSPSKGILREDFDPVSIALSYSAAGPAALSVLTEADFFSGSLDYLQWIHQRLPETPLLRKDFIFDLSQVAESKIAGASAVLLIVAILEDDLLAELLKATDEAGLAALVEVHDEEEMERAVRAGAQIIGVNNRDLKHFSVSLETSIRLAKIAPAGSVLVSESGIGTPEDIARLADAGFHAFLVGEHFMRAPDPGAELRSLIARSEAIVFADKNALG